MRRPRYRNRYLLALDALLLSLSVVAAYSFRFEGLHWKPGHAETALLFAAIAVPLRLLALYAFGLYARLWRHASATDIERLAMAGLTSVIATAVLGLWALPASGLTPVRVPLSVLLLDDLLGMLAVTTPRLLPRLLDARRARRRRDGDKPALIVGAGAAGKLIAKELLENPALGLYPVGFVDDDPLKQGQRLAGRPIFGKLADITRVVERLGVQKVVIAMPTAPGTVVRQVVRAADAARVETLTIPGLYEILSGRVRVSELRSVEIQDLLRREPVRTDLAAVRSMVEGRTVLVTGAGGSIGSELCRQVAQLDPARLVLLGHGENSIFEIDQELRGRFPALTRLPVIADVRDQRRIAEVFAELAPDVVLHAAAHKHVPLMEANVVEAVTNNVQGTRNVVEAAVAAGTRNFVLISSDKAVRPTSIMGATKRLAELVVQHAAQVHQRNFVAVRFGNVLGSRGSVVPTFLKQIRAGGPLTITHPEMRRFFMTIPEAVQLVLQAGALEQQGTVFLLDMGEPVRIVDLATDLIRLTGLEPGRDIELRFTGTRPGEKLYEEMFFRGEDVTSTSHPKILCGRSECPDARVADEIDHLISAAVFGGDEAELRRLIRALVPDFHDPVVTAMRRTSGPRPMPPEGLPTAPIRTSA